MTLARLTWAGFGLPVALGLVATAGCAAGSRPRAVEPAPPTPAEQEMLRRLDELDTSLRDVEEQMRRLNAELGAQIGELQGDVAAISTKVSAQERLLNRAATAMSSFGRQVPGPGAPAAEGPPVGPGTVILSPEQQAFGIPAAGGPAGPSASTPGIEVSGATVPAQPVAAGSSASAPGVGVSGAPVPGADATDREASRRDEDSESLAPEPSDEGQRRYDTAYRDLQRENYQLALINFRSFLEAYPQTGLSDNAQYWIGEIFYAQGQFNQAVEEFRRVIDEYPGHDKVTAAYYKIALCFINLRDTVTARRYLDYLLEHFPDAREARLAEEKIREL